MPSAEYIRKTCEESYKRIKNRSDTEIAFFGGSFTAIDENVMTDYLEAAKPFCGENGFGGIRVSTRPDAIDSHILDILKSYNVTSIELGAQSMDDKVLEMNQRGHTARDVENAVKLIKEYDISCGLQMMTGLYGSDLEKDRLTAEKIALLEPETVRIYPTVVIENTALADIYRQGKYKMIPLDKMAQFCSELLLYFEEKNIKVIKCGLHAEKSLEENIAAGYYHPSFREICESMIYRKKMQQQTDAAPGREEYVFYVGKSSVSKATGQKKANINYFKDKGIKIKIKAAETETEKYFCSL